MTAGREAVEWSPGCEGPEDLFRSGSEPVGGRMIDVAPAVTHCYTWLNGYY